ncbi:MAG TPA: endonuclease VIII [Dehalococcoidia bacterium]|nr:endonuclease VIII [Dehalococcoidia bacterium]
MIELPEAECLSRQLTGTIGGKKIAGVVAGLSPHKFAWYHGDPKDYDALLRSKIINTAVARGGMVEVRIGDAVALFSDGTALRFHTRDEQRPKKHQLLIEFEDGTAISASVQMYGGLWCFKEGEFHNPYYDSARGKPSPLSDEFDEAYFDSLISSGEVQKLSAKAFLATEQRMPGLGNGVLQDILHNARIHPRRTIATLTDDERKALFQSVKSTLKEMTAQGGRDTTSDLFGKPGGYVTKLSQNTVDKPCPICGGTIIKQSYMGGSIYFCDGCQKV